MAGVSWVSWVNSSSARNTGGSCGAYTWRAVCKRRRRPAAKCTCSLRAVCAARAPACHPQLNAACGPPPARPPARSLAASWAGPALAKQHVLGPGPGLGASSQWGLPGNARHGPCCCNSWRRQGQRGEQGRGGVSQLPHAEVKTRCRAVPCCAMLCCAMLCCAVLCCAVLHQVALDLFDEMLADGVAPDRVAYNCALAVAGGRCWGILPVGRCWGIKVFWRRAGSPEPEFLNPVQPSC